MNRQMAENAHHSVSCEPNAVFPECNQHPVLAFLLYDRLHGTKLMEAGDRFFDFFKSSGMIDSETHEVSMLYLVKQGWTLSQQNPRYGNKLDPGMEIAVKSGAATLESATADGWTGLFMHAWQPSYIEEHYPYWKKNRLARTSDGYPGLKWESWEPWVQYGFFAALAAEMGDADTRDKMLRYADAHYAPVWVDGAYHYPFSEEAGCTNLTDRLLAIARTLPANGMRAMHASPFDDEHFTEPYAESAGSSLFFRRAIYDRGKKALVLSTESASPETASSFVVRRLDKNRKYRLTIDGKETARFNGRTERPVSADFSVPHDFILYED
jgi:hypothetical protein